MPVMMIVMMLLDDVEVLDGSEVTETTRRFLVSWQANKDAIKQRLENRSAASLIDRHAAAGGNVTYWQCLQKADDCCDHVITVDVFSFVTCYFHTGRVGRPKVIRGDQILLWFFYHTQ